MVQPAMMAAKKVHWLTVRPSFRGGQRKYSRTACGRKIYDNSSGGRWSSRWRLTCVACQRKWARGKVEQREEEREERREQQAALKALHRRENFMRSRFGLPPLSH